MLTLRSDPVPIREDADGALRVGESRVLLELVINAFEDGATPEAIVQRYSSLRLSDVYSVIAHFLNHREEVGHYLRDRERKAEHVAATVTSNQRDLSDIRRRLLGIRSAAGSTDAPLRD